LSFAFLRSAFLLSPPSSPPTPKARFCTAAAFSPSRYHPEEAENPDALETFDAFKFRTMRPDADGGFFRSPICTEDTAKTTSSTMTRV
jgi:hypothetical protein